ncbi:hypothetical protein MRX96_028301 [Rhipicephalus microplus]
MPKCIAQSPSCLPSRLCLACCFLQLDRHRATHQWIFNAYPRTLDIPGLIIGHRVALAVTSQRTAQHRPRP